MKYLITLLLIASCGLEPHQAEKKATDFAGETAYCGEVHGCSNNEWRCITESGKKLYCPDDEDLSCFYLVPATEVP